MSFRMTGDIMADGYKPFTFTSAGGVRNIDNYADTAYFTLPPYCYMKTTDSIDYDKKQIPTGLQFQEGTKVSMNVGYDGNNQVRFMGFIKRINFTTPIRIECEGYSYPLQKLRFNKAYTKRTTVKQVITDLVQGTGIKISDQMSDITFEPYTFKNFSGTQVLEFLKTKYLLTCCFIPFDTLYVGLRETLWQGAGQKVAKHYLNWNTIKDDQLLFSAAKEFAQVNITMKSLNLDGTRNKSTSRLLLPGNMKIIKTLARDQTLLKSIRDEQQTINNYWGYTGSYTGFLVPFVDIGYTANINDATYPQRTGNYFVEKVEWDMSKSNPGYVKIGIGNTL